MVWTCGEDGEGHRWQVVVRRKRRETQADMKGLAKREPTRKWFARGECLGECKRDGRKVLEKISIEKIPIKINEKINSL